MLLLVFAIIYLALENGGNVEYHDNFRYSGVAAIICGVLALVAGICGLQSFKYPKSYFKSGINIAFCIVACVSGVTSLGIYLAGVR